LPNNPTFPGGGGKNGGVGNNGGGGFNGDGGGNNGGGAVAPPPDVVGLRIRFSKIVFHLDPDLSNSVLPLNPEAI
jgi:hypothetical protein